MTAIPPPDAPLSLHGAFGDAGAGRDGADAGGAADACRGGSSGGGSREKWLCISYTSC